MECAADLFPTVSFSPLPGWGPCLLPDGSVLFRLWAPAQERVAVVFEDSREEIPMTSHGDGWHELVARRARVGTLYRFKLSDGTQVPDPASRFQPQDVTGPSEVIDSRYPWRDQSWRGRAWHTAVIYELHVGTFTPEGTFEALERKLPYLAELGVTAIQLMPIGDFPGRHNWGYDGVLPYAPDSTYGRPEKLKSLIDAAHQLGLMVFLDVVYNHFGPEGNYLGRYAPSFFTERHHTPWGAAINFDGKDSRAVRDFVIGNALYWLEEFHFDGLRLDAVHHLIDDSPQHILAELAIAVQTRFADRLVHLILENENNGASLLERDARGHPRLYAAQWNDDLHHVLHTALTAEGHGYYAQYLEDESKLSRAIAEGFAFQGEVMRCRNSERGEPSAHLPPPAFIAFLQNHDQIGNRAFGERLIELAEDAALRAASAVYLLLPQIPMLFMGEEWNAREPFVFFCDFKGDLARAIREGRRREFASFPAFQTTGSARLPPDPDDPSTFASAKLNWKAGGTASAVSALDRYRRLLALRRQEVIPRIPSIGPHAASVERLGPRAVRVRWKIGAHSALVLTANLSNCEVPGPPAEAGRRLWEEGSWQPGTPLSPWTVVWSLEEAEDG